VVAFDRGGRREHKRAGGYGSFMHTAIRQKVSFRNWPPSVELPVPGWSIGGLSSEAINLLRAAFLHSDPELCTKIVPWSDGKREFHDQAVTTLM
jgi:hypothetical protein